MGQSGKVKQLIVTRFFYDDYNMFLERAKMFKDVLIPCLKSQVNKNFVFVVLIDNYESELREILQYNFIAIKEYKDLYKIARENNCQLMTRHDSDDWMSSEYVDICLKLWENSKVETLLIHFDFEKVCYYTGKIHSYQKPKDHVSGFLTICNRDYKYSAFRHKHTKMKQLADQIIQVEKGHVIYFQHDYNVLKLRNQGIKIRYR